MSRLPELVPEKLTGKAAEMYERIKSGPRGRVRGPLAAWLHSPGFAQAAHPIGEYLRFGCPLSGRLAELAILVVARHWTAQFEWFVHAPLALKAGIAQEVVDAIAEGTDPPFKQDDERVVYAVARELLSTGRLADATYRRGIEAFGEAGMVDLSGLVGYYTLGAFTLHTFDIEPEPGAIPVLPVPGAMKGRKGVLREAG